MKKLIFCLTSVLILHSACAAEHGKDNSTDGKAAEEKMPAANIEPDGTYLFETRDTCDLYLDVYEPAEKSSMYDDGNEKPTVIFIFGGGFAFGKRDNESYNPWFRLMTGNGFRVISIDYRLGLKNSSKVGIAQVNEIDKAIHIAVEDLFSATEFIIENAEMLGVDPGNIVISGSSAGAITALQAEYELCNRTEWAEKLPGNFRYAGVMSFAGAILSRDGKLKYAEEPSPVLMLHGTEDKVVNYGQIRFFKLGFFGSDRISARFRKLGYSYNIIRYEGHGHEIADAMAETIDEQLAFLKRNVMGRERRTVDMTVIEDGTIPFGTGSRSRKELYGD